MSMSDVFEIGVNDALYGRRPCVPEWAWGNNLLVEGYFKGYRSIS